MKRPPHNFVVEVRRQRRSTNADGKGWLAEPAPGLTERHPGAAALFEPERKASPAPAPAPARPQGRILPSLVDVEPSAPDVEEAAAPSRRRRESSAVAAKPKTRTKKETSRDFAPPRRSAPADIEQASATAPPRVLAEPSAGWRGFGEAGAKAAAKSPRKIAKAEPLAARAATAAAPHAASEASLENAPAERAGERQARHRRIMERYALGAELKPGERWKKRLRKAR